MPDELIALFDGQGRPIGSQKSHGCVWQRRPRRLGLRLGGLAHVLRRRPHPLADPLAPRRPLSRQPRRSSRRAHSGRRNSHSSSAPRIYRGSRHRPDTHRIGFPRPATPPIHRALRHAVFLSLHASYITGGNHIQRRSGSLRRSRARRFRCLGLRTKSRRSKAKPATRRHQTKRGHGKLRPQPSPLTPSRSWTPSAARPARSASIWIPGRSTRLSGRLRSADIALQMRQRPAAIHRLPRLGQPLFSTRT